ncbi:MAG: hypothetical protein ACE5KY_00205 [Candidatus Tectimicrobiota bacterium]
MDKRKRKESLRKAVRSLIVGFAFVSGATTALLLRKVQDLEEFRWIFGLLVGVIIYAILKRVTGYERKYEL